MRRLPLALIALALVGTGGGIAAGVAGHGRHAARTPRFDLSTEHGRSVLAGFDPNYLVAGAAPGSIPAITQPHFESPRAASRLLRPTDAVIGVDTSGDARAYPVKLLALHEVVNDVVGGRPLVVTWCPLCASTLVFDRRVAGTTLTFDVSGSM